MRLRTALLGPLVLTAISLSAQQKQDHAYSEKIKQYTTQPSFLTELVDHLPASDKVPTPEKFLGYIAGAPEKLTYAKDVYRYMREVARTSPRVRVLSIGQTEENREMILVVASDETNLAKLDRYREITARLADPRQTSDAEAERLVDEGLPLYWVTGTIHSPETASPEMLMELVYRLAVEETPLIDSIRKHLVVMITPVIEVDGREKEVDLYNWKRANPKRPAPSLIYWGKYVQHDNNRDGMVLSLALSRNVTRTYLQYHPQVFHDLHESVPFLYISTGMGPYNAWFDPIVISEWQKMAYYEIEEMTKRGVPGVWTHGFYDGWAANYMFTVAHGHNSIGRFYETFGNSGADTKERTVAPAQTTRTWFRPNPPLAQVKWSQRNNVNLQQSALLLALSYTAANGRTFLRDFYLKGKRSIAKASTEGPAAYVISAAERPNEAASLVSLLQLHGVEVHRLSQDFEAGGLNHASRSFVVRMDQPFSRMADMLLDKQYYNANDTPPYDDTGWTLGALRNVPTLRVTDTAILKAPMIQVTEPPVPEGRVVGDGPVFLVNHNADRVLATLRYKLRDVKIETAEAAFEAGGQKYNPGTFVIRGTRNDANFKARLRAAAADWGVSIRAVAEAPKIGLHDLAAPRIALVHNWTTTQNEGWFRLAMDTTGIPYSYISDHVLRSNAQLRESYDVIIFGPVGGTAQRVVNGLPESGEPVPWKASELTPNFGTSPDQTDNIRGGMGLEGISHVKQFVEQGGLFITVGGNASILTEYGLVETVSVVPARDLKVRGSVLDTVIADPASPIAYGYGDRLAVYFNQTPILRVNPFGGVNFGGGGAAPPASDPASRVSGRGGINDPDVPQGRPFVPVPPVPQVRPGDDPPPTPEMMEMMRPFLPSSDQAPRVVLRFADENDLLISGMLAGAKELAGRPAIVDAPLGKGHFVIFANNPMWRQQTQGSFMLLLNAAMNFDSLNAGRGAAKHRDMTPATVDDAAMTGELQQ
jgi:hypothetical protein